MKSRLPVFALLATSVVVPFACSSKKPNPPVTPTSTVDAGSDAAVEGGLVAVGDGGIVGDAAAPVATGPVFFTDAGAPPIAAGDAGAPALTAEALDLGIDTAAAALALKVAPKATKEGQPGRETLAQGQHFNMLVTMAPNRCYTIVGVSPAGQVTQLDLKLLAPPLYNMESGRSGAADKNMPVIGKGAQALCPILPIPVAYKLDAVATKGAGRIGVHVFARNK
jgi:hypothetical protein